MTWTLEEALEICRRFEDTNCGWHVALGGSVLKNGHSDKDLDLIFFPHDAAEYRLYSLQEVLESWGWSIRVDALTIMEFWREKGSNDIKHVDVWQTQDGRRVDAIIPSIEYHDD